VTFIEQLQEEGNPKERNKLLRALELLGRTVPGTFTETINISEVKPDEALDKLLEMSRSVMVHEKTKKLPPPLFRPDNDDDDEEIVYEYKD
jgi:chromatin remodeling complex protein RSC6